ncbi:MAG TPA: DUF2760 domain-containing protein [Polyangia bacterium]|nr:DUF2760 domain-containing protein [Polyangia bacterium]
MRFLIALRCFFLILFYKRLPEEAVQFLPEGKKPAPLPPRSAELVEAELAPGKSAAEQKPVEQKPVEKPAAPASAPASPVSKDDGTRGAVQLLAVLQREGRLLDFLQEEIDGYSDAQIGAAVRDIHRGCKKALAEHAPLEPVMRAPENSQVRVDAGFDPSRIRLTGNIVGEPPFTGTLKHHGWCTARIVLPLSSAATDPTVVAPAEVELS